MNVKTRRTLAALAAAALLLGGGAASCDSGPIEQNDPTADANYSAQKKNDPIPNLTKSLERANINEHLKRNNQPDRTRYIYLLADTGGIYAYYVIKGKVTSTGAQLTPTDDLARACDGCSDKLVVQGPTDDGSYGGDEGGIYFFTADGNEIQWNGRWLLSDQPMRIKNPTLTLETAKK